MYSFSLTRGAQCAHKSLTSRRGMHSLLPHLALPSFLSLCFLSHGQPPHLPPTFLDCYPIISAHPSSIADPLLANSSNGGGVHPHPMVDLAYTDAQRITDWGDMSHGSRIAERGDYCTTAVTYYVN